ncbi:MAG: hypothetical protein ABIP34_20375 [Rhodoferax sp.]|uniref:hypothetical protein n=1 Tax=Rhodoferax sp. TaxID=50421 RepID=UPI003265651E
MDTTQRRIRRAFADRCPLGAEAVEVPVVNGLRRVHEGVLARYGLRPSEFVAWKARVAR